MAIAKVWARVGSWRDPGALYNLGNLIGFCSGMAVALLAADGGGVLGFLGGSPAALCMSVATVIFLWGGVVYSRAWANGSPPDARLNRAGDVWSGAGAVVLGIGLLFLGDPLLACTAGALHALGKFGSAVGGTRSVRFGKARLPVDVLSKDIVLLSRLPAFAAAFLGFDGGITSISFLVCTLVWAVADCMLLAPTSLWLRQSS